MNITEIIDFSIPDIKMTQTAGRALDLMDNCKVANLPIVHNGLFVGIVSEEMLFEIPENDKIGGIHQMFGQYVLMPSSSIFDCIQLFGQIDSDIIAIVEKDLTYHGVVSKTGLVDALSSTIGLQTDGAVIILEMTPKDYSLSHISNIVEENDCKIVTLLANLDSKENTAEVFIKINSQNISAILRSLERFDYTIKASFTNDPFKEDLKLRYDEFIKYLNM